MFNNRLNRHNLSSNNRSIIKYIDDRDSIINVRIDKLTEVVNEFIKKQEAFNAAQLLINADVEARLTDGDPSV